MVAKDAPVIIVGGGAWGLSTALHMTNDGYSNITIYERAEQIPSPYSAAWDINKIVRAEYEDPFYTKLALVSIVLPVESSRQTHPDNRNIGRNSRVEDTALWSILPSDRLRRSRNWTCAAQSRRAS